MKHIFIINPHAGIRDHTADLLLKIEAYFAAVEEDHYVFVTENPGQATEIIGILCGFFFNEKVRFYACGGNGTLFEVINGISDFMTAEVAMLPLGKHNDTLAIFEQDKDAFSDLHSMVQGTTVPLDALHVNDTYYSVNRIFFGLDDEIIADVNSNFFSFVRTHSPVLFATLLSIKHVGALCMHKYIMESDTIEKEMPINFGVIMTKNRHNAKFFNERNYSSNDDDLKSVVVNKIWAIHALTALYESRAGKFSLNESGISVYDGKSFVFRRKDSANMMLSMDGEITSVSNVCVTVRPGLINFVIPAAPSGEF